MQRTPNRRHDATNKESRRWRGRTECVVRGTTIFVPETSPSRSRDALPIWAARNDGRDKGRDQVRAVGTGEGRRGHARKENREEQEKGKSKGDGEIRPGSANTLRLIARGRGEIGRQPACLHCIIICRTNKVQSSQ